MTGKINNYSVIYQNLTEEEKTAIQHVMSLPVEETRFDVERANAEFDRTKIQLAAAIDNLWNWDAGEPNMYVLSEAEQADRKSQWKIGKTQGWVRWYQVWLRFGDLHGKEFDGKPE